MRHVMVRYKVKPGRAAENEQLVRDVYEELARTEPDGLQYATYRLDDGVTFVHVASNETADGRSPLTNVEAFKRFQEHIEDRVEEGPVVTEASQVGSYRS
jgi:antibiotic biosynthesis monooxygenase